ncbi:MAG TPA: carboxypeptidase-like regulatory domain-containing protein, partial [Daejeonella sp.]|uniref:STN domain-containing protein n=1 Tax=Daejeonella sp. TaxID=2805397 RepID=UPI002ED9FAA0
MYKYLCSISSLWAETRMILKYLLVMKLTFILSVTMFLQISLAADSYSQKISLSAKNSSLVNVFKEIRKQSGFDFFYNTSVIKAAKPVSINVKNVKIEEVLEICFKGQPLTYSIENQTIVVNSKEDVVSEIPEQNVQVIVNGKVVDTKGQSLVGVSVRVKGTTTGTSTDINGNFSISIPDNNAVLTFTYIGYESKEVAVNNRTAINVTL